MSPHTRTHARPGIGTFVRTQVSNCSIRNIVHGSDTVENANAEVALWFKPEELVVYTPCAQAWLYE